MVLLASNVSAQSLIRDAEIETLLEDFSAPIIRAAGLNPQNVDIYIVKDKSLNAFVTRGQNIFFHTGLISEAETPNQLKGVIAHEVGHIAAGHLARSNEQAKSAYAAALIAAGVGLAAILAGETAAGSMILAGAPQQQAALNFAAHSRTNEAAADQLAAKYLEKTSQSSEGLIQFFEKFRYQEVLSRARRYPYFRHHPLSSQRIDNLREVSEENPHHGKADSTEDKYRLIMAQAKLDGFLAAPQTVFNDFPIEDDSDEALYARSVAHYKNADLKNALSDIEKLIARYPDQAYYYELKSQILFESGKIDASIPPAQKALSLAPTAPLLELALARSFIETKDETKITEAVNLLKSALRREPSHGFAWFSLSQAYGALGQEALAKYAIAEQAYHLGNYERASSFANRAKKDLDKDTAQYRRVADIIAITNIELSKKKRDRRAPKL